jgi:hypothetical protein
MANPHKGEVPLVAGDTTYTLRFSTNALASIEDVLGLGVSEVIAAMQGSVKIGTLRAVLWGGLQGAHKGTSLLDAGDIIDAAGVSAASEAISKAFQLAFPAPEGGSENPQ